MVSRGRPLCHAIKVLNNETMEAAKLISLASDTETRPTQEMRRAMVNAQVGDEQRREDPTVNRLLDMCSDILGKESALFLPSGTMCNIIGLKTHTIPGRVIFAEQMSHIIRAESGGPAFHSNTLVEAIPSSRGIFKAKDLLEAKERLLAAPYPYGPLPGLVCVEQTHNFGGGTIWTLEELQEVYRVSKEMDLPVHMDGARLFNAVVKTGIKASDYAKCADSVWIDFTKGLAAPLGAVLTGSKEFIEHARYYKHLFGGALRQAGIAAQACIYALENNIERLNEDHENAFALARGLSNIKGVELYNPDPETNMVFFSVKKSGMETNEFLEQIQNRGLRMGAVRGGIRAVTHLDVTGKDIQNAIDIVADALKE